MECCYLTKISSKWYQVVLTAMVIFISSCSPSDPPPDNATASMASRKSDELRKIVYDFCEFPVLFWDTSSDASSILLPDIIEPSFNETQQSVNELIRRKDESFYGDIAAMIVRYHRVYSQFKPTSKPINTEKGLVGIFVRKYGRPEFSGDEVLLKDLYKWIVTHRKDLPPSQLLDEEIEKTKNTRDIYQSVPRKTRKDWEKP